MRIYEGSNEWSRDDTARAALSNGCGKFIYQGGIYEVGVVTRPVGLAEQCAPGSWREEPQEETGNDMAYNPYLGCLETSPKPTDPQPLAEDDGTLPLTPPY